MSKTITRLFDTHTEALGAVEDLERAGIDHDRISLVSNNSDNWHKGHHHSGGAPGAGGSRSSVRWRPMSAQRRWTA